MKFIATNAALGVVGIAILTGLAAAWCAERLYERVTRKGVES